MLNRIQENCGLFGIFNHPEASILTYLGLYALQHRGQESAGIVSSDGRYLWDYKEMGEVRDVFPEETLMRLKGNMAIGHVRYSTTGTSNISNAQPICVDHLDGSMALAHNGNLVNALELRRELEKEGAIFHTSTDTEIFLHLISRHKKNDIIDAFVDSLKTVRGAYSLVLLTENLLIGARDPRGIRPLCLGKVGNSYLIASETCAFDIVDGDYIRDIEPGEVLIISKDGKESIKPFDETKRELCIFEYIYFSRPDSYVDGLSVYEIRKKMGEILAEESMVDADMVIPVPDSSNIAAIGYSQKSGLPFEFGLIRSHYIGRTFIEPSQKIRDFGTKLKFNTTRGIMVDKDIVVVDDSIVRGTTSNKITTMIRNAGARKIHMRIASPPIKFPCFYGIDTPTREELIASSNDIENIRKEIGVDSLAYLSIEGLLKPVRETNRDYCTACFEGDYPLKIPESLTKRALEKVYPKRRLL